MAIGFASLAQYIEATGGVVVSEGTLRAVDLIPQFTRVLEELDPVSAQQVMAEHAGVYGAIARGGPDWAACDYDEVAWCLDSLHDALCVAVPDGYSFGSHPDNPASFMVAPAELWAD